MSINKGLSVKLIDQEIQISIGLKTLAYAVEGGPDWDEQFIIDKGDDEQYLEFGKSILQYLDSEEEDGTTPIHHLFDSVANEALEQGAEGFLDTEGTY